jgi:WD40 repeat protein
LGDEMLHVLNDRVLRFISSVDGVEFPEPEKKFECIATREEAFAVRGLSISLDNRWLVYFTLMGSGVSVFDLNTGAWDYVGGVFDSADCVVQSVAFANDSSSIVVLGNLGNRLSKIILYDGKWTRESVHIISPEKVEILRVLPIPPAASSWFVRTNKFLFQTGLDFSNRNIVLDRSKGFVCDSDPNVAGGLVVYFHGNRLLYRKLVGNSMDSNGKLICQVQNRDDASVSLSSDGKYVALCLRTGTVSLYDLGMGIIRPMNFDSGARALCRSCFSSNSRFVCVIVNSTASVFSIDTHKICDLDPNWTGQTPSYTDVSWSQKYIFTGSSEAVFVYKPHKKEIFMNFIRRTVIASGKEVNQDFLTQLISSACPLHGYTETSLSRILDWCRWKYPVVFRKT